MRVTLNKEQAAIIASAIRPQIRAYIIANCEKYEAFLRAEREAERKNYTKNAG